jgi:hypothetical protein
VKNLGRIDYNSTRATARRPTHDGLERLCTEDPVRFKTTLGPSRQAKETGKGADSSRMTKGGTKLHPCAL